MSKIDITKYPTCWKRVSLLIRRLAAGHCERCGRVCDTLSVHHQGAPFANKLGNSQDKHDIRRENLIALCFPCHDELDHIRIVREKTKQRKAKRAARKEAHQALGIGTGLMEVHYHDQAHECRIVDSTFIYVG